MIGSLLLRGMLVGVLAGLLAFAFARTFGEPQVARAIAFGEQSEHHHSHSDAAAAKEPELVSRSTQAGIGLLTGIVAYSAAMGGLFALVFAFVHGRIGRLGPRGTAAWLALAAFVAITLVPGIKYPSNPPAVGNPETIGERTALFFVMLAISIAALAAAVALARRLWDRHGAWNASLIAAAAFLAVIVVAGLALPAVNEVPENFSATLLWNFRVATLGIHAILWTTLGLVFGALTARDQGHRRGVHPLPKRAALR